MLLKLFEKNERPTMAAFNERFQAVENMGGAHVWSFTDEAGNQSYLLSEGRNGYPEGSTEGTAAHYELSSVKSDLVLQQAGSTSRDNAYIVQYEIFDNIFVDEDGIVLVGALAGTINLQGNNYGSETQTMMRGRYIRAISVGSAVTAYPELYKVFYIPPTAVASVVPTDRGYACVMSEYQEVIGHPANNAGVYVHLGQMGDRARTERGYYVGTGTYGSSNALSYEFSAPPKVVFIWGTNGTLTNFATIITVGLGDTYQDAACAATVEGTSSSSAKGFLAKLDGSTLSWWSRTSVPNYQLNESGIKYTIVALL